MKTPEIIISGKSNEVECLCYIIEFAFEVNKIYFARHSSFWLYVTFL